MSLRVKAVASVKWMGLSMIVVASVQFITMAIMARLLLPSDFGLMGMILVVLGFSRLFADMGISHAIIYRQDTTSKQLSSLYWLNIFSGLGVFVIVCLSSPLIALFYHEPRLTKLILISATIFLITPFGQQFQILFQKELQFNRLAKIEIMAAIFNSTTSITLATLGYGVLSLIFGQLIGALVKVIILFNLCLPKWAPSFHFARGDLKGYVSFGLYQMGEKSINYLNTNFDYLLIGSLLGAEKLGYYTMAYSLVLRPLKMINPIINKVAFPVFSKVQNRDESLKRGYLKVIQLLSFFNFPIMFGFAAVAPVAVPLILGIRWNPSIILIQILCIVGLLRSVGNPVGSLLLAKGRADLGFKWNLGLACTQIPGLYAGVKLKGVVGVAVAFAFLQIIYSVFNYTILIRKLLGPCLKEYFSSLWPAFWISAMMGASIFFIGALLSISNGYVIFFAQLISAFIIYFGLSLYLRKSFLFELKSLALSPLGPK